MSVARDGLLVLVPLLRYRAHAFELERLSVFPEGLSDQELERCVGPFELVPLVLELLELVKDGVDALVLRVELNA
jgi:hypothetical protein